MAQKKPRVKELQYCIYRNYQIVRLSAGIHTKYPPIYCKTSIKIAVFRRHQLTGVLYAHKPYTHFLNNTVTLRHPLQVYNDSDLHMCRVQGALRKKEKKSTPAHTDIRATTTTTITATILYAAPCRSHQSKKITLTHMRYICLSRQSHVRSPFAGASEGLLLMDLWWCYINQRLIQNEASMYSYPGVSPRRHHSHNTGIGNKTSSH